MTTEENHRPSKNLISFAFIAIFLSFGGTGGVLYYMGMFTQVRLQQFDAPEYRFAYLPHTGPYNEVKETFAQVEKFLDKAKIRYSSACALFLDDPSVVAKENLRSKVGYLVTKLDLLPTTVQSETIPGRRVILATFNGTPVVGSYKAYSAMKEWSERNGYKLSLPSLEIYHSTGSVEYQLPITKE